MGNSDVTVTSQIISVLFASNRSFLSFFAISNSHSCRVVRDLKALVGFFLTANEIINGTRIEFISNTVYVTMYMEGILEILVIINRIIQIIKRIEDIVVDLTDVSTLHFFDGILFIK
jgi:hypothetical protein